MNLACDLVIAKIPAKDLKIEFQISTLNLNSSTAHSIYNAWMETAIIDNHGAIWILPDRFGEIIRTSKCNAKYIVDKIGDEHKKESAVGTYLRYSEVNNLLNKIIENPTTDTKERYAAYSESIGMSIRDSPEAKLLRLQAYIALETLRRKLKKQRLSLLSLSRDELTGKPLLKSSHFSHIRSCAIYPQFMSCVWNGLVINTDIHQLITQRSVNDEVASSLRAG
jgi:hypothetical protein